MNELKPIETIYKGYRFRSRLEARWAVFFDALGIDDNEIEYEPEGFILPSGKYYLPDFKIKCYGKRGGFSSAVPCFECKHHIGVYADMASWFEHFCEYCNPEKDFENPPDWIETRDNDFEDITKCQKFESVYPFDLYIEVKGNMTQEDADKIHEFARCGYSVLVVGNIPNPDEYYEGSEDLKCYEPMNGIRIYPWNYETIDGDYFAAFPAVENGCFYLDGDDSNYKTVPISVIRNAFKKARQARFEHGERPTI